MVHAGHTTQRMENDERPEKVKEDDGQTRLWYNDEKNRSKSDVIRQQRTKNDGLTLSTAMKRGVRVSRALKQVTAQTTETER